MARKVTSRHVWISTAAAWLFGFLIFLPILWMVLTSFKTELDAFAMPPKFLLFHWTTENYATVQERSDYFHHALNSIIVAGGSTLIAMLSAVPAAWSPKTPSPWDFLQDKKSKPESWDSQLEEARKPEVAGRPRLQPVECQPSAKTWLPAAK